MSRALAYSFDCIICGTCVADIPMRPGPVGTVDTLHIDDKRHPLAIRAAASPGKE
jgi:hypothetical protein